MGKDEAPEVLDKDLISQTSFEEVYQGGQAALPPAGRALPRQPGDEPEIRQRELPRLTAEEEAASPSPPDPDAAPPEAPESLTPESPTPESLAPESPTPESPTQEPSPPTAKGTESAEVDLIDTVSGWNGTHDKGALRPLSALEEVRHGLDSATDHREVGTVLARHALSKAKRVVLLVRRGAPWVGWTGAGEDIEPEKISSLVIPPVAGTIFGLVTQTGGHYLGPLVEHPVHRRFLDTLGLKPPASVGLFPIQHDGRAAIALYLDGGAGGSLSPDVADVLVIAQHVPRVLSRLAREAGKSSPGDARARRRPGKLR